MLNKGVLEIIKINNEFYEKNSQSFDRSREFYWEIFQDSLNYLKIGQKIIDIGCGNGRYYKFLKENKTNNNYFGYDNNQEFIDLCKKKYPESNFEFLDIIQTPENIIEKGDLVVVFGVTHHIPNREFRKDWYKKIKETVLPKGVLILSFWNFNKEKHDGNFQTKDYKIENGDYFLGWKGDYSAHRYCHYYSEEEIKEIKEIFNDFSLLEEFTKEDNKYLIFQKNL